MLLRFVIALILSIVCLTSSTCAGSKLLVTAEKIQFTNAGLAFLHSTMTVIRLPSLVN